MTNLTPVEAITAELDVVRGDGSGPVLIAALELAKADAALNEHLRSHHGTEFDNKCGCVWCAKANDLEKAKNDARTALYEALQK